MRRTWASQLRLLSLVLVGIASLTCGELIGDAPGASCAEAGARCQLDDGPVGICERSPCAAGAEPPCFTCTPQH